MDLSDATKLLAEHDSYASIKAHAAALGIPRTTLDSRIRTARQVIQRAECTPEVHGPPVRLLEGKGICTLEELLADAGLNPDEWIVDWTLPNAWTGPIGKGEMGQFRQIKAMLRPRWPDAASPVQPIRALPRQKPKTTVGKTVRVLLVPDSQNGYEWTTRRDGLIPYHDRQCWDLALQIAQLLQPDIIVFMGDMLDLAAWSLKFKRTPLQQYTTQPALDELHWWLAQFRLACPPARIVYLGGNHEKRMDDTTVDRIPEAFELHRADEAGRSLGVAHLLALNSIDIEYVPYDLGVWLWGDTFVHHGRTVRKGGGATVAAILREGRSAVNEVVAHIHRLEVAYAIALPRTDRRIFALSPGTLARIDGIVPSTVERVDWHQGCAVLERVGDRVYNELVEFWLGEARFRGLALKGNDRVEEIVTATGWEAFKCSSTPQPGR